MPNEPTSTADHTDPLPLQIYAAMLGDAPAIDQRRRKANQHSPFVRTTLRDRVERCATFAARALDEARERLAQSKPKPLAALDERETASATPVVLVGPAVVAAKHGSARSRAA